MGCEGYVGIASAEGFADEFPEYAAMDDSEFWWETGAHKAEVHGVASLIMYWESGTLSHDWGYMLEQNIDESAVVMAERFLSWFRERMQRIEVWT